MVLCLCVSTLNSGYNDHKHIKCLTRTSNWETFKLRSPVSFLVQNSATVVFTWTSRSDWSENRGCYFEVFSVQHSSYRLSVGESFIKTGLFSCCGVSVIQICCCVCLIVGSLLWSYVLVKHFVNLLWESCFIKQTLLTDFLQNNELLTLLPFLQQEKPLKTLKPSQNWTHVALVLWSPCSHAACVGWKDPVYSS